MGDRDGCILMASQGHSILLFTGHSHSEENPERQALKLFFIGIHMIQKSLQESQDNPESHDQRETAIFILFDNIGSKPNNIN